jgi:hypothetical protein
MRTDLMPLTAAEWNDAMDLALHVPLRGLRVLLNIHRGWLVDCETGPGRNVTRSQLRAVIAATEIRLGYRR